MFEPKRKIMYKNTQRYYFQYCMTMLAQELSQRKFVKCKESRTRLTTYLQMQNYGYERKFTIAQTHLIRI